VITLDIAQAPCGTIVHAAVNLDDNASFQTCEICDKRSDRNLATKAVPSDLAFPEQLP
jgi:hypothetical protein